MPFAETALDLAAMRLAIEASRAALAAGDRPFGATLVSAAGEVPMTAGNNQVTTNDVTGHADVDLLSRASPPVRVDTGLLRQEAASALRGA